jgi:hypothetical protein
MDAPAYSICATCGMSMARGVEKGAGAVSRPLFRVGRPEMHHFLNALRDLERGGGGIRFIRRLSAVALFSSVGLLAIPTFAQVPSGGQPIRLFSPQELCTAKFINRHAGADRPLIRGPVHIAYYEGGIEDSPGLNLVLALLSYERLGQREIEIEFRRMLDDLNYQVTGHLDIKRCHVFSASQQEQLSFSHPHLTSSGWPFDHSFPRFRVPAYYVAPRTPESLPLLQGRQPGTSKSRAAERAPPRPTKQSKPAGEKAKKTASSGAKPQAPAALSAPPPIAPPDAPKVDPDPVTAAPAPIPEKSTDVAALPPNAPEIVGRPPEVQRKSLKRYPRPDYKEGAQPLPGITALRKITKEGAKRDVFAVEEIQCGEDGNWLVGYTGRLELVPSEDAKVLLTQRHALNNYPGAGVATLEKLRSGYADAGGLQCDAGGRECDGPAFEKESYAGYRQELLADRRSGTGTLADPRRHSCRPDKRICISQEREHWRCNLAGNCLSYDPTRWWCAWRQEFCFSRVKFGGWGSPIKENDLVRLKLDGSAAELVYDMSDGFLRIAQDALTRICGPGETKLWKANWARPN